MQRKPVVRWSAFAGLVASLGFGWMTFAAATRPWDAPAALNAQSPPAAVAAQSPPAAASTQTTPEQVRAVVDRLFDAMREADSIKARSVFAEGARFASVVDRAGTQAVQYTAVDGFVASIGRSGRRWDERLYDVEVRVDDNVAFVWAPYSFYQDGQLRHCGIDSIDFLRLNGEWKITQLADTRRMEGCRHVPPGGQH